MMAITFSAFPVSPGFYTTDGSSMFLPPWQYSPASGFKAYQKRILRNNAFYVKLKRIFKTEIISLRPLRSAVR
jgi:hypothetical protein